MSLCAEAGDPRVLTCRKCGGSDFGKAGCKPCNVAKARDYRLRNPDARKDHYRRNKDRVLAQIAEYRKTHPETEARAARYARNKAKVAQVTKAYREANRPLYAQAAAKRRAARKQATPSWADPMAIRAFYDEAARLTRETASSTRWITSCPSRGKQSADCTGREICKS